MWLGIPRVCPSLPNHLSCYFSPTDPPLDSTSGFGSFPGNCCVPDELNGAKSVRDLYELSQDRSVLLSHSPHSSSGGRYTVPVLWDKQTKRIVNNESIEILKILNTSFNELLPESSPGRLLDLFPPALAAKIEETNSWIYPQINNGFPPSDFPLYFFFLGVYRAGFAQSQQAYEQAVHEVFAALDRCEEILSNSR